MIPVIIDAEDAITAAIAHRLMKRYSDVSIVGVPRRRGGVTAVARMIPKLNQSAHSGNFHLVVIDLDSLETGDHCAARKITTLMAGAPKEKRLLIRIAVFEGESWLLADWDTLRQALGIRQQQLGAQVDEITDAKEYLLQLVHKKAPSNIKRIMVASSRGDLCSGPEYTNHLVQFIYTQWKPETAAQLSYSLMRTIQRLDRVFASRASR